MLFYNDKNFIKYLFVLSLESITVNFDAGISKDKFSNNNFVFFYFSKFLSNMPNSVLFLCIKIKQSEVCKFLSFVLELFLSIESYLVLTESFAFDFYLIFFFTLQKNKFLQVIFTPLNL